MGLRGPAPHPTALRILHGEEERRINRHEPQPSPGLPGPPEGLNETSRAVWDYVVAELSTMNLAKRPDRDQLHAYVEAVRMHAQAVRLTQVSILTKTREGTLMMNPAVRVQTQAATTMFRFAREFGLTPASRVQFKAEEIAEDYAERLLS
jgi:P27 family predicted phage terminase small subunit